MMPGWGVVPAASITVTVMSVGTFTSTARGEMVTVAGTMTFTVAT